MINFYKIAANTFKESIREPIFGVLLLFAVLLIGHFPSMALFVFSEQLKLVVDSSMATTLLFGLFVAVFSASHTVSREMRNGTVLLLMSKPVSRWAFILAKIFGIVAASVLFVFICSTASVISIYVAVDQFRLDLTAYLLFFGTVLVSCIVGMLLNFFRGDSFPASMALVMAVLLPIFAAFCMVFKESPALSMPDYIMALILLFFAVSAMATITVVFATRLDMVANLCICSVIFFLGLISSFLFQRETGSAVLDFLCSVFYAILPNWQFFWVADALAVQQPIPMEYVIYSGIYVVIYIILCSIWAVAIFLNREIAKDAR